MDNISRNKLIVGKMFDDIAPTYDKLNHLMSGRQDIRWRKKAINHFSQQKQNNSFQYILDIASGSGDLAAELMKLNPELLFSIDLSIQMLKINKQKVKFTNNIQLQCDALSLPFPDNIFDIIAVSFGVRNFENLKDTLLEIYRSLKRGGKFLTIEMFRNSSNKKIIKYFNYYFSKIIPKMGNIISHNNYAYNYLFKSVDTFLTVLEYEKILADCGFKITYQKNNFLGIVYTLVAEKI